MVTELVNATEETEPLDGPILTHFMQVDLLVVFFGELNLAVLRCRFNVHLLLFFLLFDDDGS